MKSKKQPKKPELKKILYVKLSSLDDLSRYVCNYDYTNSALMCIRHGGAFRILALGEEIGKIRLVYYINTTKAESAISYTYPSSMVQKENSSFIGGAKSEQSSYIRIIGINRADLKEAQIKGKDEPPSIMLASTNDLVSAVLLQAAGTETIPYIYSFMHKGKRILCAFDVIDGLSEDSKIFYYAISDRSEAGNFARYKYSENKIDFTEYMGEHSYMYAKIINLAEPFPFFKMPD